MKVDSKSSQLGAVSTWMGDLVRIPTEGFEFYSFFSFFFFSFFLFFFVLFSFYLFIPPLFFAPNIHSFICLFLFIFKGTGGRKGKHDISKSRYSGTK